MIVDFDEIKSITLSHLDIKEEIFERAKNSRIAFFVQARQFICLIAYECGYKSSYIARELGIGRTTVVYHIKKAQEYMRLETSYRQHVEDIVYHLKNCRVQHSMKGWLARDKEEEGGFLYFIAGEKPKRDLKRGTWAIGDGVMYDAPKEAFPQITWEREPWECEMILKTTVR